MKSADVSFDRSGIYSQAGFAFQMKVFLHYASELKSGNLLSYEYLDDIVIRPKADELLGMLREGHRLIQAKRTTLSGIEVARLFVNWVDAFRKDASIKSFTLVQSGEKTLHKSFESMDSSEFVKKVHTLANVHKNSLSAKLIRDVSDDEIESYFKEVKQRSVCWPIPDIDSCIADDYQLCLHYGAISDETYKKRLDAMQGQVCHAILESMLAHETFSIDHADIMKLCEDICAKITDSRDEIGFNAWRASSPSVEIEALASRRDVIQLHCCFDNIDKIVKHIYYGEYYSSLRFRRYENCQSSKVEDLEGVTYENYEMVCDDLRDRGQDNPRARLNGTKRATNSHCFNDEEKWGSCIFLTSERAPDHLRISWKDDKDE